MNWKCEFTIGYNRNCFWINICRRRQIHEPNKFMYILWNHDKEEFVREQLDAHDVVDRPNFRKRYERYL